MKSPAQYVPPVADTTRGQLQSQGRVLTPCLVSLTPGWHKVVRRAKLQVAPELLRVGKSAVASQIRQTVGAAVVNHGNLRWPTI